MMNKLQIVTSWLLLVLCLGACEQSDFESKFDKSPDERINEDIANLKAKLTEPEHGWLFHLIMADGVEYAVYGIARFEKDYRVSLLTTAYEEATESEYTIFAESDIQLVFNTYNANLTAYATPNQVRPNGYGTDIEYHIKSIEPDVVELEGKVYKTRLLLKKATEAETDLSALKTNVERLNKQRTAKYMALSITKGLDATPDQPKLIGMDCSTYARVAEIRHNYEGEFVQAKKNIFFTHAGFGLSSPMQIGNDSIQYFKYNETEERYELDHPTLEGYLYCDKLPVYFVDGMVDEFMDHFSMKLKNSFGLVWDKYIAMKKANTVIRSFVLATDYKRRIPLFDEKGNPILDDVYNHDYELGDHLGEGFLFSFHEREQFYYYWVSVEVQKIENDRIRFVRQKKEFCTEDEKDSEIGKSIRDSNEFQEFVNYLCNDDGWMIRKTIEAGQTDFDFYSLENPDNYFYTRLY